jgi:hypothetical protein
METPVFQEIKDQKENLDFQDKKVLQECKDLQEITDKMEELDL